MGRQRMPNRRSSQEREILIGYYRAWPQGGLVGSTDIIGSKLVEREVQHRVEDASRGRFGHADNLVSEFGAAAQEDGRRRKRGAHRVFPDRPIGCNSLASPFS